VSDYNNDKSSCFSMKNVIIKAYIIEENISYPDAIILIFIGKRKEKMKMSDLDRRNKLPFITILTI